ncbi:polysaccharide deacetylase family protein [Sinomonas sp. JGH33]|uniref:Polysaccharide deacetylase family protein n=1 Tax=Sinomonas terricola TaxID=3110330 RepID=A0ABU5T976_9MICC|nr:polysaccharide deacetylase family protein [Sinomonas sp. JGH33]MEA5455996.1 polysaccharide deacetylase family protein [Sinomonas sp. JGH33]
MPDGAYSRDLTGYGEHPPAVTWPGGSRVAVSLVLNIEEGAERSSAPGQETAIDYGARAGIWRVLRILDRHGVKATAFCCALALESNPAIAAALAERGYEIADHGYGWDAHAGLTPEAERELIVASRDSIAASTGDRPTSWYSKDGLNPHTRRLLVEEGFAYESNSFNDDLPHWGADAARLPVLPYSGDTNDAGLMSQFPTGQAFAEHLIGCLDLQLDDPRGGPSVMSVGLHPRIIGRPAYAGALDRFLEHAISRGAWIATRREIIEAWLGL